ncbi:MAG: M48 family metallopeptidase [Acidobacteria bacterium]|nr:M48 family metallopeptidase [Acidobacteriota bacterium]
MKVKLFQSAIVFIFSIVIAATPVMAQKKKQKPKPLDTKNDPQLIGKRDINKGQLAFYGLDREVALGRQLAREVDRSSKFVTDPAVTEYVNRIAQNLVLHSDAKVPFTIKVIDSNDVNAFALPGGFLYVNRGLLEAADNEAEVAGVLSHEIAHVTARHGIEQASKAELLNYASIGLIFFGGIGGYIAQQALSVAVPLTFLKFSRGAEKEADRLGAQYMWASGYDPTALITFFEKLQSKEKGKTNTLLKVFSTHPLTGDRITEVRELITQFPERNEYQISSSEFNGVKSRVISASASSRSINPGNDRRPTLKRRPDSTSDDDSSDPVENERPVLKRRDQSANDDAGSPETPPNQTERPVLKRRDGTPAGEETGSPSQQTEKPAETTGKPTLKRRTDSNNNP